MTDYAGYSIEQLRELSSRPYSHSTTDDWNVLMTALPSLLSEVERLQKERDALRDDSRLASRVIDETKELALRTLRRAESAERALAEARQGWIAVSERLPEGRQVCLCIILDNGQPYYDVWTYDATYPNPYWKAGPPNGVICWRPLPTHPEVTK